jgi:hypothetical protein
MHNPRTFTETELPMQSEVVLLDKESDKLGSADFGYS